MNSKSSIKQRIDWIDYLKVVGMFFIIYGHMFPRQYISHMLSAFFVPVFFVASGYLCKNTFPFPVLIKKLRNTILLYIIICTLNFFIHKYLMHDGHTWLVFLQAVLIGNTDIIGTMWFVYTLVMIRIFHNYIIKIKHLPILVSGICFLILLIMGQSIRIPNAFLATIISLPFFEIGYYISLLYNEKLQKHIETVKTYPVLFFFISISIFFIIWLLARINNYVNFYKVDYGNNFMLFIINSLLGIYATFLLSILIMQALPKSREFFTIMSYGNIFTLGFQLFFVVWAQTFIGNYLPPHFRYTIPAEIIAAIIILLLFFPVNFIYYKWSHKQTLK